MNFVFSSCFDTVESFFWGTVLRFELLLHNV